jgi:hypothetical protein
MLIKNLVQKLKNSIFINSLKAKIRNTCTLCLLKGYIQIDIHFHSQYTNLLLKRKKNRGKIIFLLRLLIFETQNKYFIMNIS